MGNMMAICDLQRTRASICKRNTVEPRIYTAAGLEVHVIDIRLPQDAKHARRKEWWPSCYFFVLQGLQTEPRQEGHEGAFRSCYACFCQLATTFSSLTRAWPLPAQKVM